MSDAIDALETLWYFGSFWSFVLSRRARAAVLTEWRSRTRGARLLGLLEAALAALIGLGPFVLLGWLISG